jgi:hypothetical protein
LVTDCKPGLVCVTRADETRFCTNDLTAIASTEGNGGGAASPPVSEPGSPSDAAVTTPVFGATASADSEAPEVGGSTSDSASAPDASLGGDVAPGDDSGSADGSGGDDGSEPD